MVTYVRYNEFVVNKFEKGCLTEFFGQACITGAIDTFEWILVQDTCKGNMVSAGT